MSAADGGLSDSYSPWSVVNLVFTHLAAEGLHPVLGESGDPSSPARDLLLALGIEPTPEGSRAARREARAQLARIRTAILDED